MTHEKNSHICICSWKWIVKFTNADPEIIIFYISNPEIDINGKSFFLPGTMDLIHQAPIHYHPIDMRCCKVSPDAFNFLTHQTVHPNSFSLTFSLSKKIRGGGGWQVGQLC